MTNTSEIIRPIMAVTLMIAVSAGCGWEADAVAPHPGGGSGAASMEADSDSNAEEEAADEHRIETIAYPFEADEPEQPGEDDRGDDPFDEDTAEMPDDPCPTFCVKTLWCGDHEEGSATMASCLEGCEYAVVEKMIDPSVFECIHQAEGCEETRQCYEEIELCDHVCQWHDNCEGFDGENDCTQWCGDEISAGRMNWDSFGCLIDTVEGACPAFGMCGVSQPGS